MTVIFSMLKRLTPRKIKIFGRRNQKLHLYNPEFQSVLINKANPVADHGGADWLGYWDEFVQKARFKKFACLRHIQQNNLTYLG